MYGGFGIEVVIAEVVLTSDRCRRRRLPLCKQYSSTPAVGARSSVSLVLGPSITADSESDITLSPFQGSLSRVHGSETRVVVTGTRPFRIQIGLSHIRTLVPNNADRYRA